MRNFMRYVSLLGDWPLHAAVGLVLLGLAWRRGSEEWTRIFLAMLLAMMLAGVAGTVIKRTVPRARPSVHTDTRWGGPHFSSKYHSFPSGHVGALTAFFARSTYRASARRPCVPSNPDSDRALTDVYRRALSVRRRLRSGSGNLMRACRSALPIAANRTIGNRQSKIRWRGFILEVSLFDAVFLSQNERNVKKPDDVWIESSLLCHETRPRNSGNVERYAPSGNFRRNAQLAIVPRLHSPRSTPSSGP